jgi:hypothetical protein
VIYLDSSALLKLLFDEPESAPLAAWLAERADVPTVSSDLVRVEVVRATRRLDQRSVPRARTLVAQLDLVPLTGALRDAAAETGTPQLRSLGGIHLECAESIRPDLAAFVAYDNRLIAAAAAARLRVAQVAA